MNAKKLDKRTYVLVKWIHVVNYLSFQSSIFVERRKHSMYLTIKQQVKHLSRDDYKTLKELCHTAKNLSNQAIYNVRQYYFKTKKYLNYQKNYSLLKQSENYKILNSNMAQQILKEVDGSFQSFFGLLRLVKEGKASAHECRLPHYLPKDGYATLIIGFVRLKGNKLVIPFSNTFRKTHKTIEITIPPILLDKKVKEIRIIPKADARFFEIQYTYEVECIQKKLDHSHALALDLGINNLVTAVTDTGRSFIIDGRRLKAVNQWYNKENARLQSIRDRQRKDRRRTKRQQALLRNRNNKVNDYISKAARRIIDDCLKNDIGRLVVGYQETFQRGSDMGKVNNQSFTSIPYGKLIDKLEYLCERYGIEFVKQEESYTSKASFWDKDEIPVYEAGIKKEYRFSGKRTYRGMYETGNGRKINADVNGALNILRKSRVVPLEGLYSRGEVDTPVRIRIA